MTPGAERWRFHFCESRINKDAAAQQATCHQRYHNKITRTTSKREQTMSTTTTSDWNDAVAKVMAESGASKEAAEEALRESGGDVDGAIFLLSETFKSPTKPPPPPMDTGPTFIDDVASVAAFNRNEKRIDDDDDDAVAKSREKSMYAPWLRTSAATTTKASDDITGKTS
jgi:NACalpha-BTF3-like transcription factor